MTNKAAIVVLVAALASAASAALGNAACLLSKRTVSVTGVGSVGVTTTIAVVQLGVVAQGKTAKEAQETIAKEATRLVTFLRQQTGVTRLQTSGISLRQRFDNTKNLAVSVGFEASNTVSFEVPVGQAGSILDGAVSNGATRISSVSFKATEKVIADARDEAIRLAVAKALREAKIAATAAGRRLGKPATIAIEDGFVGSRQLSAASFSPSASSPVIAQEQQVTARVSITYETS